MKKIIFFFVCYLLSVLSVAQDVLTITPSSSLHIGTGGILTLHNTSFNNNGAISTAPGGALIRFTGNVSTSIQGNSLPLFDIIQIEKTGGAEVTLLRNINVRTGINFTSGMFNLNGNTIFLATNGTLNGESAASHIIGATGFVEGSMVLNAPVSQNPGNLGAVVSSSQNLGLVIVRRGHQSQTNASGNGNSILRYYDISSANNTALNATLRFNYLDAELNGLSENGLDLWKSTANGKWTNEGFTSRDAALNYVEKTGIASFSRWTLSSSNNALPVDFTFFNTHCENGKVSITWKTAQELNSSHFNIERSQDGSSWVVIGSIPAAGNSGVERTYKFTDNLPLADGFYRIAQYDLDGYRKYSLVARSSCNVNEGMKLWPNPAQSTTWLSITTNTGSPLLIKLYDSKGRLMHTQRAVLTAGTNQIAVSVYGLPRGVYQVAADYMNGTVKTFRLVKN